MPKPPLPEQLSELLTKPNPSVITTVCPDGQPVSVATWYLWENGQILVNRDEGRKRPDYMRARHYIGEQYPSRQRNRISAWIEIDRWHGWGAAENTDVIQH